MDQSVQRMLKQEASWEEKLGEARKQLQEAEREAHEQGKQLVQEKLAQARAHAAHHRKAVQTSTQEHVRDIEQQLKQRLERIRAIDAQELADTIRV